MTQPELHCDSRYLALASEQAQNLDRVSSRIESAVLDFMAANDGTQFYGADLLRYVEKIVGPVAPDSPRRILSLLQSQGKAHYSVINRARSLYYSGRKV
jgi:hypothetical protein